MRATAAIAGLFVLLAGLGVGTYCIVFRSGGVQPVPESLELGILAGGVAFLALLATLSVLSGGKRAGGGETRRLLQSALEVDATDPDALRAFASVPPLRDLVSNWMGERAHVRELGDRVEALRGEINGIAEGMQRSAHDMQRIREQPASPHGVQIVASWNTLIERVKQADAKVQETAAALAAAQDAAAVAEPVALTPLGPSNEPIVRTLVARLDELESELDRLRGDAKETATRGAAPALEILEDIAVVEPLPSTGGWQVVDDEATDLFVLEPEEPEAVAEPAVAPVRRVPAPPSPARPAVAPAQDPQFDDLHFPHFVGKPVRDLEDRVAVTYEGQDAAAETAELPADAFLFEDEEPQSDDALPVFDLSRLTAPERER